MGKDFLNVVRTVLQNGIQQLDQYFQHFASVLEGKLERANTIAASLYLLHDCLHPSTGPTVMLLENKNNKPHKTCTNY